MAQFNMWHAVTTDDEETGMRLVNSGLTKLMASEAGALVKLGWGVTDVAQVRVEDARRFIFEMASEGHLNPYDWFEFETAGRIDEGLRRDRR